MWKLSSDPPNLGGSQEKIYLIWDRSEETFRLITSCAAPPAEVIDIIRTERNVPTGKPLLFQ